MNKLFFRFFAILLLFFMFASVPVFLSATGTATEGQVFEWNGQSGSSDSQRAWSVSKGISPDGLWRYQLYSLEKKIYQDLVFANGGQFAWTSNPGSDDNGYGYARVRSYGANFHPGNAADIVKRFTCPAGGTIRILTTVARNNATDVTSNGNGTSFAIYLGDVLIYPRPGEGSFVALESTAERKIEFDLAVKEGEQIYFRIGAMGNQGGDAVNMSNTITYLAADSENSGTHNWETWTVVGNAKCTDGGTEESTCTRCGMVTQRVFVPRDHSWGYGEIVSPPSCTSEGSRVRSCLLCKATETQTVEKAGHDWGEWKLTKTPTSFEEGKMVRQCVNCTAQETQSVEKLSAGSENQGSDDADLNSSSVTTDANSSSDVSDTNRSSGSLPLGIVVAAVFVLGCCFAGILFVIVFRKKIFISHNKE